MTIRSPVGRILMAASGKPIDIVVAAAGSLSSPLRFQFLEDPPSGQTRLEWHAAPFGAVQFEGEYEHIQQLRVHHASKVWCRVIDENGFAYESPTVDVQTYYPAEVDAA